MPTFVWITGDNVLLFHETPANINYDFPQVPSLLSVTWQRLSVYHSYLLENAGFAIV